MRDFVLRFNRILREESTVSQLVEKAAAVNAEVSAMIKLDHRSSVSASAALSTRIQTRRPKRAAKRRGEQLLGKEGRVYFGERPGNYCLGTINYGDYSKPLENRGFGVFRIFGLSGMVVSQSFFCVITTT